MWFENFMHFAAGLNIGVALMNAVLGNWVLAGVNVAAAGLCWPWWRTKEEK